MANLPRKMSRIGSLHNLIGTFIPSMGWFEVSTVWTFEPSVVPGSENQPVVKVGPEAELRAMLNEEEIPQPFHPFGFSFF